MKFASKEQLDQLFDAFYNGSILALSQLLTIIDNYSEIRSEIFSRLYLEKEPPLIIGITGSPGVGKSSFINEAIFHLKKYFASIAVLAFDPSSIFTGGSFLGDRVRMRDHVLDDSIFIRSISAKGQISGMSNCVFDLINALWAFGFKLIIIETVGAGQTEIDIKKVADIVTLLISPTEGDEIQLLKAGILEIPDIIVIHKSDLPTSQICRDRIDRDRKSIRLNSSP